MGRGIPKMTGTVADYVLPLKRRGTVGWQSGRIGGCRGTGVVKRRGWEGVFPRWQEPSLIMCYH